MVTAAAAVAVLQVAPLLILRLVAVIAAATVELIAPPVLMATAPRALVALAPLTDRIPVTLVLVAVSASVLVASVPDVMVRLLFTTVAAPSVTAMPVFLLMVRFCIWPPAGDVVPIVKVKAVPPVSISSEPVVLPFRVPVLVYVPESVRLLPFSTKVEAVLRLPATATVAARVLVLAPVSVRCPYVAGPTPLTGAAMVCAPVAV